MKEKYYCKIDNEIPLEEEVRHITIATTKNGKPFMYRMYPEDVEYIEIIKITNKSD